jgi:hypothetical protein
MVTKSGPAGRGSTYRMANAVRREVTARSPARTMARAVGRPSGTSKRRHASATRLPVIQNTARNAHRQSRQKLGTDGQASFEFYLGFYRYSPMRLQRKSFQQLRS